MTFGDHKAAARVCHGRLALWFVFLTVLYPKSAICLHNAGGAPTSGRAQLRVPPIPGQEPAKPWCRTAVTPSADATDLLETAPVISGKEAVTYVYLVSAGRLLTVGLQNKQSNHTNIRITVASKQTDEGAFVPICKNIRFSANNVRSLEAYAPSNLSGSVWRVEVVVDAASSPDDVPTFLQIRREPNSDFDPEWSTFHGAWNDALGYLCIDGDAQRVFSKIRSTRGFGGRVRLDVDSDQPTSSWTSAQRQGVRMLILRAVSLWVTSCFACTFEHLALVKIDNQLFLRAGLANWLDDWSPKFRSQDTQSLRHLEASLKEALEPVQLLEAGTGHRPQLRKKAFTQYVTANPQHDYSGFCELPITEKSAPVLWNVQTAFCSPDLLDKTLRANILVRFRDGLTACGDSPNIIACRADLELTEYNSRDFSFAFDDREVPPIGRGRIQVNLLHALMHEMGHWIGLPHIDSSQSIMASGLDRSRCIDYSTLSTLVRLQTPSFDGPSAFRMYAGPRRRSSGQSRTVPRTSTGSPKAETSSPEHSRVISASEPSVRFGGFLPTNDVLPELSK